MDDLRQQNYKNKNTEVEYLNNIRKTIINVMKSFLESEKK